MIIKTFSVTPFEQNCRVVVCEKTGAAICIDPGESPPELVSFLKTNDFSLQAVTLTHAHLDHIGGVSDLSGEFPEAQIILHADDEDLYDNLPQQPLAMGVPPAQLKALGFDYEVPPKLTRNWQNGEIYAVGELNFKILHAPGHTRGHVILVEESERAVFSGDCLFAGSIGRTDLPGGDFEQLLNSINNVILPVGDDFTVYSGHGGDTTIGAEKRTNPFLTGVYKLAQR